MQISHTLWEQITWFTDNASSGDPDYVCSVCHELISENTVPLLFWKEGGHEIARIHIRCWNEYSETQLYPEES